jgi:hypothetical protein
MRVRWVVAGVVGLAIGWLASDRLIAANGDAAAAVRTVVSSTGDAGKVVGGALIGALVGGVAVWIVARSTRRAADRTRLQHDLRTLATALYQAAERHRQERADHWAAWTTAAANGLGGPVPDVPDPSPVRWSRLRCPRLSFR